MRAFGSRPIIAIISMRHECYDCHIRTVSTLIDKFQPDLSTAEGFEREIRELLDRNPDAETPYLATLLHRRAKEVMKVENLYEEEKHQATDLLLSRYGYWKEMVESREDSFRTAAMLAVTGNIIDYGAHSTPKDIDAVIHELLGHSLARDDTEELKRSVGNARSILYLGDNAGEVVFDRLFIETMGHPGVIYVVRGAPVINDVTMEDADRAGMHRACRVIDNGYDAPSTLLPYCSEEVKDAFHEADLVISKGQGNFEGLMHEKRPNLFFLLMAKCDPMANLLGVQKGDLVITKSNL